MFCKNVFINVVASSSNPALNAILESSLVNCTCLNGLKRHNKNKLTYILTYDCNSSKYCGALADNPNAIIIYKIHVIYIITVNTLY